jgi:hypothetical protein
VLREDVVRAVNAGRHAGRGVRDVEDLEQLLHRAVLAVATVQRDESD